MVGCFVVYCNSGLVSCTDSKQISWFSPPADETLFNKWKRAIPKRNRVLSRSSRVCSRHFKEEQIIRDWTSGEGDSQIKVRLRKAKLTKNAIPSIFPEECPASCVPRVVPVRKPPTVRRHAVNTSSRRKSKKQTVENEAHSSNDVDVNLSSLLSSPIREVSTAFNVWDGFDAIQSPQKGTWTRITLRDMKAFIEHELSNHLERAQITIVRELRILKNSNEIRSYVLGKEIRAPQLISSMEELTDFTTSFFESLICTGLPCPPGRNAVIQNMKYGFKNVLDRWQSKDCLKIREEAASMCSSCDTLRHAVEVKFSRISNDDRPRTPRKRSFAMMQNCKLSPTKMKYLRRSSATMLKARRRLEYRNKELTRQVEAMQQKLKLYSEESIEDLIKRLNIPLGQGMVVKEIINIAKCSSKHARRYSSDWLLTCMLMHIRNPAMYAFVQNNNILPLPHKRTIKNYLGRVKIGCGFDPSFFDGFKKKMSSKTEYQKHGVLVFDEVSVRKALKTDPKTFRYHGVVDFGENDTTASTEHQELADHALVFGFSSVAEDYFQPIGCFSAKGATKGIILAKLVLQAIILLEEAGAKVIGLICDGAKPNRSMWKELGVTGKLGSVQHFIENPVDDTRKIFIMSDIPHLFKCIRNRLIKHEVMSPFGVVRWEHYRILFDEDKKLPGNLRLCPRVTEAHVRPCNFAKMRVSLMTQIFSNSVSHGLNTYRKRLVDGLEDSEPTAKFSLYMNNLFDCLNRGHPAEGIRQNSPDIQVIKEGISFLDRWEKEVRDNIIREDQFLTQETTEGLRVTLHSVLDIIDFLHGVGFSYVLTAKINQDKLEQFFGTVRQAGCQNDHPAMPTFLQLYRLLSTYTLIKPPRFGNCTVHEDDGPKPKCPISMNDFKEIFNEKNPSESKLQTLKKQLDSLVEHEEWNAEEVLAEGFCTTSEDLVDITIYYASGYLCPRLIKKTKCATCKNAFLTKLNTSTLDVAELVNLKTKGFLSYCNLYLFKLFRETEIYFSKNAQFSDCYERTLGDVFSYINLTFPCEDHKSETLAMALHYFIVMRMRQYEREQNRSSKKNSRRKKKEAKLSAS